MKHGTRTSIGDGILYPAEEQELRATIGRLLGSTNKPATEALALISPHGAYTYTETLIASAFKRAYDRPVQTAVIVGPAHSDRTHAVYLPGYRAFNTPLGDIAVNQGAVEHLLDSDKTFRLWNGVHDEEHCIEVQLPFLQYLFPEAELVPMLVGGLSAPAVRRCARALSLTFSGALQYILFVVTCNCSSYLLGRDAEREADVFVELVLNQDSAGMWRAHQKRSISSCGVACVDLVFSFPGIQWRVDMLGRESSDRIDGQEHKSVHYAAFSLAAKWEG